MAKLYFFFQAHLLLWACGTCVLLCPYHELDKTFWVTLTKVKIADSGPSYCFLGSDSMQGLGSCSLFLTITWLWQLGKPFEVFHVPVSVIPGSLWITRFLPSSFSELGLHLWAKKEWSRERERQYQCRCAEWKHVYHVRLYDFSFLLTSPVYLVVCFIVSDY